MYTTNQLRDRFVDGALTTASGPKIVVMCFDRLDRDLVGAVEALETHNLGHAHELLCHAQDLLHELLCMLDLDAWEHAVELADIYRYVITLLTRTNVSKNPAGAREARVLLGQLGDAFRQASTTSVAAVGGGEPSARPREFSIRA